MRRVAALVSLVVACSAALSQSMPTQQDIERRMRELQQILPQQIEKAEKASGAAVRRVQPSAEQQRLPAQPVADPSAIARQYQAMLDPASPADKSYPVMVFVSLSMPVESLKHLSMESARSGVPLLVRGLKYGVGVDNVRRGLDELRPYAELGATILIHPEGFEQYNVTVVPTFVIDPEASSGCKEGVCVARTRRVIGEVTLEFALDEIAAAGGETGRIAQQTSAALRARRR